MNHAINRFSLDVHSEVSQIQLDVRRWETARSLYINLTENGMPYEIARGCTAEIAISKPDGSILKNACQIVDNEIIYDFTSRTTVSAGTLDCEIRLMDGSGNLLTSPQFSILVHSTIYDNGDAVEQEIVNANTVKSANPGYAEVFMWSDGNPDGEDRVGYFVTADMERSAAMVKKADAESVVRGVSMAAPGFASNGGTNRYDDNSNLISQYCYVGLLGFAPVIDNGACTVNGKCNPGADGTAVPDASGDGFLVVERVDDTHVLILLEPSVAVQKNIKDYADTRTVSAVLPAADWVGAAAPYTLRVAVEGLTDGVKARVFPAFSGDAAADLALVEACAAVNTAMRAGDTITFTCLKSKPTADIPVNVELYHGDAVTAGEDVPLLGFGGSGGLKMELFWENASPASSFGATTFNFDFGAKIPKYVIADYKNSASSANLESSVLIPMGKTAQIRCCTASSGIFVRTITVEVSGTIVIGQNSVWPTFGNSGNSANNSYNIPVAMTAVY